MKKGQKLPEKIKQQHQWVCWLDATGMSVRNIERETNVDRQTIYRLRRTRLYLALRDQYILDINEKGIQQALASLNSDAVENIRFFRDMRDGEFDDLDSDARSARLAAGRELLGIQFPKKTESKSDATHRFVLEDARRVKILDDCEEAGQPIVPIPLARAIEHAQEE
jgi:hypothetical protein